MIQTMVLCYWFVRNKAKIRGILILYKPATNLFAVRHSLLDTSRHLVNTQVSYLITILSLFPYKKIFSSEKDIKENNILFFFLNCSLLFTYSL